MFITQAIFTTKEDAKDALLTIMTAKLLSSREALGCISSELWATHGNDEASYCLVTKWGEKDHFQSWMRESHSAKGKQVAIKPENMPSIIKTLYQFEQTGL